MAIAGDRATELDDLPGDPGVEAALDRLGADLAAQGLLTEPKARRRLVTVQAAMLVWAGEGARAASPAQDPPPTTPGERTSRWDDMRRPPASGYGLDQ